MLVTYIRVYRTVVGPFCINQFSVFTAKIHQMQTVGNQSGKYLQIVRNGVCKLASENSFTD